MKRTALLVLAALAAACVGCKKDTDTPKDPLLSYAERANFSVVGKIYVSYFTNDYHPEPFYNTRYFVSEIQMDCYDTDRADGQRGKYDGGWDESYYLRYPYIIKGSQTDTLFTFVKDSTEMRSQAGDIFTLVK